jgi:hypothetical protein
MEESYWQNKYQAQKRAKAAYKAPLFCAPADRRVPCIIHGVPEKTQKVHLHHLNEYGKGHEECWFFENLVPICSADNDEIDDSRRSKTTLAASNTLSPTALLARSLTLYLQGELLRAYGCARLGSFLAWGPGRPGWNITEADPNPTIELATQCLFDLRNVDPQYAVPLATDTLDRSILPRLHHPLHEYALTDATLFDLAVAAGSFHRDYRDYARATRYFDLAEQYSERLRQTDGYIRFVNHRLINSVGILETGSTDQLNRDELRNFLAKTEFVSYLQGRMNILYWRLRELRLHGDPTQITDLLDDVLSVHYSAHRLVRARACRDDLPAFSPKLFAEYLLIGSDAWSRQDRKFATQLLRDASKLYKEGHFGASRITGSKFVEGLVRANPMDFSFPFKNPAALDTWCPRTKEVGATTFQNLSHELFKQLKTMRPRP